MSAQERSGWRDESISRRHRTWGINAPAVDVDFLMVEYDRGLPVATVDYKAEGSVERVDPNRPSPNLRALGELYGRGGQQLPFFVVHYTRDLTRFHAVAMNRAAADAIAEAVGEPAGEVFFSEAGWVLFIHWLRGYTPQPGEMMNQFAWTTRSQAFASRHMAEEAHSETLAAAALARGGAA